MHTTQFWLPSFMSRTIEDAKINSEAVDRASTELKNITLHIAEKEAEVRKEEELYKDFCFRKVLFTLLKEGLWNVAPDFVASNYTKFMQSTIPDSTPSSYKTKDKVQYRSVCDIAKDRVFIVQSFKASSFTCSEEMAEQALSAYLNEAFGPQAQAFSNAVSCRLATRDEIVESHTSLEKIVPLKLWTALSTDNWEVVKAMKDSRMDCWYKHQSGCFYTIDAKLSSLLPQHEPRITDKNRLALQSLILEKEKVQAVLKEYEAQMCAESFVAHKDILLKADHWRADLPIMEEAMLTDNAKGHWDLYQPESMDADTSCYIVQDTDNTFIARNPESDIQQNSVVAIDFGTSSTVVAVRDENRAISLKRIGVQNFSQKVIAKHFENPTALECIDYTALMSDWCAVPYRPYIKWKDIHCSHRAKAGIQDSNGEVNIVNSGIVDLKTWARRKESDTPLRLRDQKGTDFTLNIPPASMSCDVEQDYAESSLNPIELYAYFLGLHLNNQIFGGGQIYCKYYLTFPVKFDRETRSRILSSFHRGLERTLAPSLAYNNAWRAKKMFSVEECGSEPTAYAAAALPMMEDIALTEQGTPFGVFDFGGGTTDFAFGLYRMATLAEEDEQGWETVLDILDTAGDENLGGEHLLKEMAAAVIEANLEKLAQGTNGHSIPFMLPKHIHFYGDEPILDTSAIAQSNTIKLCEALRPLWEEGTLPDSETGQIALTLWNKAGEDVPNHPLDVAVETLQAILRDRIRHGVKAFFAAFTQAFKKHGVDPQEFHILLAGNSCRSSLVMDVFTAERDALFHQKPEAVTLHEPLLPSEGSFNIPNLKTGVALGLLGMIPGEAIGLVERHMSSDESPFRFCVGRFSRNQLKPALIRNASYDAWAKLGTVRTHGQEILGYSLDPAAIEGNVSDSNCASLRFEWDKADAGKTILIKAHTPTSICLALSNDDGTPDETTIIEKALQA